MSFHIRTFRPQDASDLVAILKANGQYLHPDAEGPEAMRRVAACEAAVFLVAEKDGKAVGMVRGVYDGARATLHLLSVHPDQQGQGIGSALAQACLDEFHRRGAPSASVTAASHSESFWNKLGFDRLPVFLMLKMLR